MKNKIIYCISLCAAMSGQFALTNLCLAGEAQSAKTIYIEPIKAAASSPAYLSSAITSMLSSRISEPGRLNVDTNHTSSPVADFIISGRLAHEGDKERLTLELVDKKRGQIITSASIGPVAVDELPSKVTEFAMRVKDTSLATSKEVVKEAATEPKPVLFDAEADNDTKAFARMHPDRLLTKDVPASDRLGGEKERLFADIATVPNQHKTALLVDPSGKLSQPGQENESLKDVLGALPASSGPKPMLVTDQPAQYANQPPPPKQDSWWNWLPWTESEPTQNRVTINADHSGLPYPTPSQIEAESQPYSYVTTKKQGYFSRLGSMFSSPTIPDKIASQPVSPAKASTTASGTTPVTAIDNRDSVKTIEISQKNEPAQAVITTDVKTPNHQQAISSETSSAAQPKNISNSSQQTSTTAPKNESWLGTLLKPFSSQSEPVPADAPVKTQEANKKAEQAQKKPIWQWN